MSRKACAKPVMWSMCAPTGATVRRMPRVRPERPAPRPTDPRRVEMIVLACLAIGAPILTVTLIGVQLASAWRAVQVAMFAGM